MFPLNTAESVLVILERHASRPEPNLFPFERTQQGMAEELGVSRGFVAHELKTLVESGLIEYSKGHAAGSKRRVMVYRLTPLGLEKAKRLSAAAREYMSLPRTDGGLACGGPEFPPGGSPEPGQAGNDLHPPEFDPG